MVDTQIEQLQATLRDFQQLQHELLQAGMKWLVQRQRYYYHHHLKNIELPDQSRILQPAIHFAPLCPITLPHGIPLKQCLQAFTSTDTGFPIGFTSDEVTFVINTGVSITITNDCSDFSSIIVQPKTLQGIGSGLAIEWIGDAE